MAGAVVEAPCGNHRTCPVWQRQKQIAGSEYIHVDRFSRHRHRTRRSSEDYDAPDRRHRLAAPILGPSLALGLPGPFSTEGGVDR